MIFQIQGRNGSNRSASGAQYKGNISMAIKQYSFKKGVPISADRSLTNKEVSRFYLQRIGTGIIIAAGRYVNKPEDLFECFVYRPGRSPSRSSNKTFSSLPA